MLKMFDFFCYHCPFYLKVVFFQWDYNIVFKTYKLINSYAKQMQ